MMIDDDDVDLMPSRQLRQARLDRANKRRTEARARLRTAYLHADMDQRRRHHTHTVALCCGDIYFACVLCMRDDGEDGGMAIHRGGDATVRIDGELVCGPCVGASLPPEVTTQRDALGRLSHASRLEGLGAAGGGAAEGDGRPGAIIDIRPHLSQVGRDAWTPPQQSAPAHHDRDDIPF